jgi:hypothetical protein
MRCLIFTGDENGLFPNETTPTLPPAPVASAQKFEHAFIKEWLKGMYPFLSCTMLWETVTYQLSEWKKHPSAAQQTTFN